MNLQRPKSSIGASSAPNSMHCAFARRPTRTRATPSQPPAGGSPWSKWMPPHARWRTRRGDPSRRLRRTPHAPRLLLHVAHRQAGARAVRGLHLGYHAGCASCPIFILATSPSPCFAKAPTTRAPATATSWAGRCPGTRRKAPLESLLTGRRVGMMYIVCYLRRGSKVFETYWTTSRGVEAMDNSYTCST